MGKMVTGFPTPSQVLGNLMMKRRALIRETIFLILFSYTCSVEDDACGASSKPAAQFPVEFR